MATTVVDRTKELSYLFDLKEEDITDTFIIELFGEFNGKQKSSPSDIITIPPGKYGPEGKKNKNHFTTTVGLWVYNKLMFEQDLFDIFGYINQTIDAKMNKKINAKLSYALTEDKITVDQLATYLMKPEWCMQFVEILAYNYSEKILTCSKIAEKKKKELVKKYEKELAEGDVVIMNKIEQEVLDYVLDYLGEEESLDVFKSGARGSLGNNFKNIFVMNGAIKNYDPNNDKDFVFASSNYIDGIAPEEYSVFADSMTNGPYARGKKTQLGGYWEKLFGRAYETVILDKAGTDCKTDKFETVELTDGNVNNFMYSWVKEDKELVELTSENMDKYVGKSIQIRFPTYCKSKTGYCSKCAGNLFYRTNRHNVGVASPMIPSILKNVAMKSFHNSAVSLNIMNVGKAFGYDKTPYFLTEKGTSLFFNQKDKKLVFYVPEELFNSNLVLVDGEIYSLLGIFEYAIVDIKTGKQDVVKNMNFPSIFQTKPNRVDKQKGITPTKLADEGDYRLIEFLNGDMVIKSTMTPELIEHVEEFFKMFFITTKMPRSIAYNDLWKYLVENFKLNGGNYNVDYHLLGILVAENCRDPKDVTKLFRWTDMKDMYDYVLLSVKETPKFNSPFSALTSEHFDQAVISAVLLSDKADKDIKNSPLEKLIM